MIVFVAVTVAAILWMGAPQRHDAAGGLIEIYKNWGTYTLDKPPPEMKPIILQVPQEYRYGSSKGATRNWGINIVTFYPGFTSPQAPENFRFAHGCTGDCNGQIFVSIDNWTHGIHHPENTQGIDYPNMGDLIAHVRLKYLTLAGGTARELSARYGFDRQFEVKTSLGKLGEETSEYLLHLAEDRTHYDLIAECKINEFARTCRLHFSLKCNPAIYVQVVGIDMSHVEQLLDVVEKTDRFVTSMVRVPACT